MPKREKMSNVDAAWLGMDDPTNLMMITGVMFLETPMDIGRFKEIVQERMVDRFPRFRKKIVRSTLPLVPTYWEDDPHFTIDSHVQRVALPAPGDQDALQEFVSDMMSTPLDLAKPPWHMLVIENYGAGCAVLGRLHHAIADGIALMQVLLSLTDNAPDLNLADEDDAAADDATPIDAVAREVRSVVKTGLRLGDSLMEEGAAFLANPTDKLSKWTKLGFSSAAALGKVTLMPPDNKTVFSGPLGVRKSAVWSLPIALADVKAVGRVTGGTVNDVLLTAMAGAIGRYLRSRDSIVDNIRAFVPVNLRPVQAPLEMGNKFGLVILTLPVGIEDTLDRLLELKRRMDEIKNSPEAIVVYGVLGLLGASGQQVEDFAIEFFGKKGTAVMTNVPGPREKIYLAGAPIGGLMFWVPQSGRLGLGVSIFSYNNEVTLGVAVDANLVPDPENIIEAFHTEFAEMLELVHAADEDAVPIVATAGPPAATAGPPAATAGPPAATAGPPAATAGPPAPTPPAPTAAAPAPAAPATAAAAAPPAPARSDDLTRIKGVGPKIAAVLNERGVTRYDQMAALEPKALAIMLEEAGVRLVRGVDTWPAQAAALDVIRTAEALNGN